MHKKLFLLLLITIYTACNNNNSIGSKENKYHYNITQKDSTAIPIEASEYFRSIQNHIVEKNDNVFLYRESRLRNGIEIYDWIKK